MIPCKTCGRNADFCDCARRRALRLKNFGVAAAFLAFNLTAFGLGYLFALQHHGR
jgi:hypothetical protein